MKQLLKQLTISALVLTTVTACSSNGEVRDLGVTAVKALYEPANDKSQTLATSASATLHFEWAPALAEDGGNALYEVVFDKVDGDFSKPVHIEPSHNNGADTYVDITHKRLNQIAAKAGIESAQKGTIKWTVVSSKGVNTKQAAEERKLTITRLAGFADIPEQLYIIGAATEAGNEPGKAIVMTELNEGEFEVYTQLAQGASFKFVSALSGTPKEYSLSGEKIVEGGEASVAKTGIYHYYLDFNIGAFTVREIKKVSMFLCWSQREIELPYLGNSIWGVSGYAISGLTGNDNSDDRYKFRMESSTGKTEWRAPNNDSKPTGNAEYYYMVEKENVQQWTDGQIWKSPSTTGWSDKSYDITFMLKGDSPYTHNLVIK